MYQTFLGFMSYLILGGFFTLTTMSIVQENWWYTFAFSTVFFIWFMAMFFTNKKQ